MPRRDVEFDEKFYKGFSKMRRAGANSSRVMGKLKTPLRRDLLAGARRQESPEGSWDGRSSGATARAGRRQASVKRGRVRKASKTRGARQSISFSGGGVLLGELPDKTVVRKRGATVEARNPVPWSGAHDQGATVGRGSELPARPFVYISPEIQELAGNLLTDNLLKAWAS